MPKKLLKRGLIAVALALVAVVGGTWAYINVIRGDAPARLTLEAGADGGAERSAQAGAAAAGTPDGRWTVADGSQAGYRVKEVLFGQSTEAVGRTSDITGSITIEGASVTQGSFTVDMTTVSSDESRRDEQFRGRIMDTGAHPTATFELTTPIDFGDVEDGQQLTASATGNLTLRGTTKEVTFGVEAKRTTTGVEIAGSVPIVFAEWGIPNPSFGPAQTEDNGVLEFLLVLER